MRNRPTSKFRRQPSTKKRGLATDTIDDFALQLLEEAKYFLEQANSCPRREGIRAYLHASVNLGVCAWEAHVNAVAEEFLTRPNLDLLDRSVLEERDIELSDGRFSLVDRLTRYRSIERFEFLWKSFSRKPLDKTSQWWSDLHAMIYLRNQLTHPKRPREFNAKSVGRGIHAVVCSLNALYKAIYKRAHPLASLQLESTLDF